MPTNAKVKGKARSAPLSLNLPSVCVTNSQSGVALILSSWDGKPDVKAVFSFNQARAIKKQLGEALNSSLKENNTKEN